MENKERINFTSLIVTGMLVIAAFLIGYWIINFIREPLPSSTNSPGVIEVDSTSYNKINESKDYGLVVTTGEAGYGRTNPFTPY